MTRPGLSGGPGQGNQPPYAVPRATGPRKRPLTNYPFSKGNWYGERPNSLVRGGCSCSRPCHGWSAATTDERAIRGWDWSAARAVGYHPGGAGVTVVDLDDAAAVQWARRTLPATRVVSTTRGEHWIYRGTIRTTNLRSLGLNVDVKSLMQYVQWRGVGIGETAPLPAAVVAVVERSKESAPDVPRRIVQARTTGGPCPHRTPSYLANGVRMGVEQFQQSAHPGCRNNELFRSLRFILANHGMCGCMGPDDLDPPFDAARSTGLSESEIQRRYDQALSMLGL
ncbi:bifunctional DNA primase/polymerase [Streptomyces sp. 4.24]|uniref:bifunctional DNA primase/polymerase n=1 Tax=Streptomyces tritrimontium TaxID=3406573 RepID=UPI003BB6BD7D